MEAKEEITKKMQIGCVQTKLGKALEVASASAKTAQKLSLPSAMSQLTQYRGGGALRNPACWRRGQEVSEEALFVKKHCSRRCFFHPVHFRSPTSHMPGMLMFYWVPHPIFTKNTSTPHLPQKVSSTCEDNASIVQAFSNVQNE